VNAKLNCVLAHLPELRYNAGPVSTNAVATTTIGTATFGPSLGGLLTVNAYVVRADDGTGVTGSLACNAITNNVAGAQLFWNQY
jgi:hypothetical protein